MLNPPVQDRATEIHGLLHRLPRLSMTGNNTKAECSHYRALPTHHMKSFCNHALVTKERMASPLDFTPELKSSGQPTQEAEFLVPEQAFSTQCTGFSICHLMNEDMHTLKVVQHATASALNNQEATATFLLLSNWMENSTNAFHRTCTDNKDVCALLGNNSKTKVRYMPSLY